MQTKQWTTYKKLVLGTLQSVLALEEREPNEETSDDVQHEFSHDKRRIAPMVYELVVR